MSASIAVPEALHICPRCGDLASGTRLCEDCTALKDLGRKLNDELRDGLVREQRRRGARAVHELREWLGVTVFVLGCGAYGCAGAYALYRLARWALR
jgi:hypothetical protein